jgi:hypothetical protein
MTIQIARARQWLEGIAPHPDTPDFIAHVVRTDNPHQTTAAQVGAATSAEMAAVVARAAALETGEAAIRWVRANGAAYVARTIADKLRDAIHASDVTRPTDDAAHERLNELMGNVSAEGGGVIFLDGRTWRVGGRLVQHDNVTLMGVGPGFVVGGSPTDYAGTTLMLGDGVNDHLLVSANWEANDATRPNLNGGVSNLTLHGNRAQNPTAPDITQMFTTNFRWDNVEVWEARANCFTHTGYTRNGTLVAGSMPHNKFNWVLAANSGGSGLRIIAPVGAPLTDYAIDGFAFGFLDGYGIHADNAGGMDLTDGRTYLCRKGEIRIAGATSFTMHGLNIQVAAGRAPGALEHVGVDVTLTYNGQASIIGNQVWAQAGDPGFLPLSAHEDLVDNGVPFTFIRIRKGAQTINGGSQCAHNNIVYAHSNVDGASPLAPGQVRSVVLEGWLPGDQAVRVESIVHHGCAAPSGSGIIAGSIDAGQTAAIAQINGQAPRNHIVNGRFAVAQRGDGPFPAGGYTVDGVRLVVGNGASCAVARQPAFTPDAQHCLAWSRTVAGSSVSQLSLPLDDVRILAGQRVTLTFDAHWSGVADLVLAAWGYQVLGTGGSAPGYAVQGFVLKPGLNRQIAVSFDLPSIDGKTIGTAHSVSFGIDWDHIDANGTLKIQRFHLDASACDQPQPAPHLPASEVLAECRRQFQRLEVSAINGTLHLPIQRMARTPTASASAGTVVVRPDAIALTHTAAADVTIDLTCEV